MAVSGAGGSSVSGKNSQIALRQPAEAGRDQHSGPGAAATEARVSAASLQRCVLCGAEQRFRVCYECVPPAPALSAPWLPANALVAVRQALRFGGSNNWKLTGLRVVHAQRARALRRRGVRVWLIGVIGGRNGAMRSLYAWQREVGA